MKIIVIFIETNGLNSKKIQRPDVVARVSRNILDKSI